MREMKMAIDYVALQAALENDARYDSAVRGGRNRELLALLNAPETGRSVFQVVNTDDLLDAIGDGVRALTANQRETLKLYLAKETVDFTKANILTEIQNLFATQPVVLNRITAIASRPRSFGEAFGGEVTLRDLWKVLPNITKSYMVSYIAGR